MHRADERERTVWKQCPRLDDRHGHRRSIEHAPCTPGAVGGAAVEDVRQMERVHIRNVVEGILRLHCAY